MLFPGFRTERLAAPGVDIHAVIGPRRDAPALLLLHGYPQTHAMWCKIAPRLAQDFTVVAPVQRGNGRTSKPPTTPDLAR